MTKTRRTVYIEVENKLIPLGTAQINYYLMLCHHPNEIQKLIERLEEVEK